MRILSDLFINLDIYPFYNLIVSIDKYYMIYMIELRDEIEISDMRLYIEVIRNKRID